MTAQELENHTQSVTSPSIVDVLLLLVLHKANLFFLQSNELNLTYSSVEQFVH